MRQPLWIVNSSLLLLLGSSAVIMLVLRKKYRAYIMPIAARIIPVQRELQPAAKQPFEKIYLQDFFDTYAPTPEREELPVPYQTVGQ